VLLYKRVPHFTFRAKYAAALWRLRLVFGALPGFFIVHRCYAYSRLAWCPSKLGRINEIVRARIARGGIARVELRSPILSTDAMVNFPRLVSDTGVFMKMKVRRLWQICAVTIFALCGCSSTPDPTVLKMTIGASPSINPDVHGRPSPVIVRLYELKSPTAFLSADFFSLYDKDQETLGADLVLKEEIQLTPGEKRQFRRLPQPDTRHIGAIAAFRDLEHAQWRSTAAVPLQQTSRMTISLDGNNILITAQ